LFLFAPALNSSSHEKLAFILLLFSFVKFNFYPAEEIMDVVQRSSIKLLGSLFLLLALAPLAVPASPAAVENDMISDTSAEAFVPVLAVEFDERKATLTPSMKEKISDFINKARAQQGIKEVYVAAFADRARDSQESLSERQQHLARDRGDNLRAFLENGHKVSVSNFNMAQEANVFSKFFRSEDAKVKGDAGVAKDAIARAIQREGKPRIAVLVVDPIRPSNLAE
jgi:hypothetical protein